MCTVAASPVGVPVPAGVAPAPARCNPRNTGAQPRPTGSQPAQHWTKLAGAAAFLPICRRSISTFNVNDKQRL